MTKTPFEEKLEFCMRHPFDCADWEDEDELPQGNGGSSNTTPATPPLHYSSLESYVTNFFNDPDNKDCAQEFMNRLDFDKYKKKAKNAAGLDFFNDNDNYRTYGNTSFNALPVYFPQHPFHLSGPHSDQNAFNTINSNLSRFAAFTFNGQNTIVIGANFYSLSPKEKNITIVHEIFHIYFDTPDHIPIARSLGLGEKATDADAWLAIDTWLQTDCGHK